MEDSRLVQVHTTGEIRDRLHQVANEFDPDNSDTKAPIVFGNRRRAQAVIVPIEWWPAIEAAYLSGESADE